MNRSRKRPLTPVANHRSTKRRKSYDIEEHPKYSTRIIPWPEQKQLPRRFHEHGEGFWPALRIIEERVLRKRREYLIEWEEHPTTHEKFEPTWTPAVNVNSPLLDEWEAQNKERLGHLTEASSSALHPLSTQKTSPSSRLTLRKIKNRRIVPDSSSEPQEDLNSGSARLSDSSTIISSPALPHTEPVLEISETQQPGWPSPLAIHLPPPPSDKTDYESIRATQLTEHSPCQFLGPSSNQSSLRGYQPEHIDSNHANHYSDISGLQSSLGPLQSELSPRAIPAGRSRGPARVLDYSAKHQVPCNSQLNKHSQSESDPRQNLSLTVSEPPRSSPRSFVLLDSFPDTKVPAQSRQAESIALQSSEEYLHPIEPQSIASDSLISAANHENDSISEDRSPSESLRFVTQLPLSSDSWPLHPLGNSSQQSDSSHRSAVIKKIFGSNMSARATRQSPRLQVATPVLPAGLPRVAVRSGNSRTRSGGTAPEISSPLAATAPDIPQSQSLLYDEPISSNEMINNISMATYSNPDHNTIQPGSMHIDPGMVSSNIATQSSADGSEIYSHAMPIQESIEEELASSNEDGFLESKASSSQQSLEKEQVVPQQDGLIMPDFPVLGQDEYCLALPAEGKVQAIYTQTIKVKRKAIVRFIRRRGSVNLAGTSATKTIERNSMLELIQRLHDTTTHLDLGLPGVPTQYTLPSSEHAAYAEYAGSKFVFLGCLVDDLMRRDCTIAIMAQPATQDLIEEYLIMKNINVTRHDRPSKAVSDSQSQTKALKVELLCTKANEPVDLHRKPVLVIAFDASFESLDPQMKHLRAKFPGQLPVLHLIVTNSSEHVERCLPASMPSPIRLKLLVRATYQAHTSLGGPTTYVEDPADIPVGRPMDMLEFSKAIRKSPRRKLAMLAAIIANTALSDDFAANWTLKTMPALVLDELEDTPPSSKESRATSVVNRARSRTPVPRSIATVRGRSQTPVSVIGTPNSRKRLLDADMASDITKRPRMGAVTDAHPGENEQLRQQIAEQQREIDRLQAELAAEKAKRQVIEVAQASAETKQLEWQTSLAQLQRRYEKRVQKSHQMSKENKRLVTAVENGKSRIEKLNVDNAFLKTQLSEAKTSLTAARDDLKSAGGDIAATESAREEARIANAKTVAMEKSIQSTKRDFEFVRNQYQDASSRAAELANQVTDLEKQNSILSKQASDEKRRLKQMSQANSSAQHLSKIAQLEQEKKQRNILLRKQEDDLKLLKRNRGVQTRGSSVQPGSPGPRSRQASPAAGYLGPPSGSRASVLRHER